MLNTVIVIPARHASTRLPGKPLAMIAGKTMVERVHAIAMTAAEKHGNVKVFVTTEDERIHTYCSDNHIECVKTPVDCPTGTDRTLAAISTLGLRPDFVINLQGDTPLMKPAFISAMIDAYTKNPKNDIVTPVVQLDWDALDQLRKDKDITPFSGTTTILDKNNNAVWFSKNIIPAIRKEDQLRAETTLSPVYRHIGLYGYRFDKLEEFVSLPESHYETLEGLEQLRALENGFTINCVKVEYGDHPAMSGVDSPEDIKRTEALLKQYGLN